MKLFIQIRDGKPYEHPIFGDNFREAFPDVDVENLPPEFAKFVRVEQPHVGPFQVNEGVTYEFIDGVVHDVWHIRDMSAEERAPIEARLTQELDQAIADLHVRAETEIQNAKTDAIRTAWQEYVVALNAWELVDLANPLLPRPPVVLADGTVISTSASGSAPNVIG